MDILELRAVARTETGKGPAGRLRAEGRIPAVLYGEKIEPVSVSVDSRELHSVISREGAATSIVKLAIDGGVAETAMIKEIQRDPIKDRLVHIDFMKIAMDTKVTAQVSLAMVGDSVGVKEGGIVQQAMREVEVEALPTDLPENIEVDITEMAVGDSMRIADLTAPAGVVILSNLDDVVLSVVPPTKMEEVVVPVEEELEEGEVAEVGEEGEAAEEQPAGGEEKSGE